MLELEVAPLCLKWIYYTCSKTRLTENVFTLTLALTLTIMFSNLQNDVIFGASIQIPFRILPLLSIFIIIIHLQERKRNQDFAK